VALRDRSLVLRLQSAALEVLQLVVARGDVSRRSIDALKSTLVNELVAAIQRHELALQSKILHILHSTILISTALPRNTHHKSASTSSFQEKDVSAGFETLLIDTIVLGISTRTNRPVLQHWVDFVLMTASQMQDRPFELQILAECVSNQLRSLLLEIRDSFAKPTTSNIDLDLTDVEPVMLLTALERLVGVLGSVRGRKSGETLRIGNEASTSILGLVSGVFASETPTPEKVRDVAFPALIMQPKVDSAPYFANAVEALLVSWTVTSDKTAAGPWGPSKSQILLDIRDRISRLLDRMFSGQPGDVIAVCVRAWEVRLLDVTVRPAILVFIEPC
jgi:hypothetical protein